MRVTFRETPDYIKHPYSVIAMFYIIYNAYRIACRFPSSIIIDNALNTFIDQLLVLGVAYAWQGLGCMEVEVP